MQSSALISRDVSAYASAPIREIDHSINWLTGIRQECDHKISALQSLKQQRQRQQRRRDNLRDLALELYDDDYTGLDRHTLASIIIQRLACSYAQAYDIAGSIHSIGRDEHRRRRDKQICALYQTGEYSAAALSRKFDLSRQQIHSILKARPQE